MQCPGCGIQLYDNLNQCPNCAFVLRPNYNPNLQNQYIQNKFAQNSNIPYYGQSQMNGYNGQPFMNGMGVPRTMSKSEFEQIPEVKKWCKEIKIAAIVLYVLYGLNLALVVGTLFTGGSYYLLFIFLEMILMLGLTLGSHLARNFPCAVILVIAVILDSIMGLILYQRLSGWWLIIGAASLLHPTCQYIVMKSDFKRKGWLK